jgi:hypothetical protein
MGHAMLTTRCLLVIGVVSLTLLSCAPPDSDDSGTGGGSGSVGGSGSGSVGGSGGGSVGGSGGGSVGGSGGSGGGSVGGGGGGGATGGTGTPVRVQPTTQTTAIPANSMNCSGNTYGSKGDLPAINTPVSIAGTSVTMLTLRYDMNFYFGEPTRKAVVSWNGTGSLSNVLWLAEVHDKQGRQYVTSSGQRVFASYLVGTIRGPGAGFGSDTTGSPSWSQAFVTWDDAATATAFGVPETAAKSIYKNCFTLANVRLVKLNTKHATSP